MANLVGILGATDVTPVAQISTETVTDAINQTLERYVAERNQAFAFFVEDETTSFKTLYPLGGGDEMQELGPHGRPIEDRQEGRIETAYPIRRFGSAFGYDAETFAYMTAGDLDRQVNAKTIGNARTHRRQILRAIFNNLNEVWRDEVPGIMAGDLTIRRLANGDGTTYPAVAGSDVNADDNHYLASGYAATGISATNNPLATLAAELREHGGTGPVAAVINPAQRAQIQQGLTNFVDAPIEGITAGADTPTADAVPGVPGDFVGVDGDSGVYVFSWDAIPATYIGARAMATPAPLRRRVHAPDSLRGFKLEAEEDHDPLFKRTYRDRFGYGAGNRLGMAIMQLVATGDYVIPAAYA
jgi:hypothetical protein